MTAFATPIASGLHLERVTHSAPVPDLRFAGDPLMWLGVPPLTAINAFAMGTIARAGGLTNGVLGIAGAWTLFQVSPLPQRDPPAFKLIPGGLPVQLVIVMGTAPGVPDNDDCLQAGALVAKAPVVAGVVESTAFISFAFQDRLCRDPLTWAEAIASSGSCDAAWPQFVTELAGLPGARNLRLLDGVGSPLSSGTVAVTIDTQPVRSIVLTPAKDGDTGIPVLPGSRATVGASSATHPIVAPGDSDSGAFEGAGFRLAAGARMAQILDADKWLTPPDPGVQVRRWNPGTFIEPIQEGTPYFKRLVADLRTAKPNGAAELAGWAFVKGSLTDPTIDWPLAVDPTTTLISLVNELRAQNVDVRFLVNKFMQFDQPTFDDFPELGPILLALYMSLSPLQVLLELQTDPAGYAIGLIAVAALEFVLSSPVTVSLITKAAEYSVELVDALNAIDPSIATWTPYPVAFRDNPLVQPPPFDILGHAVDDLSHLGVYHQKFVNIRSTGGQLVSFLGGIDINSDRLDMPIHRAAKPFHDVQLRITGPAVADVIRSYEERANFHGAQVPIATPAAGSVPDAGSHLVQIARTYFKPAPGSSTQAYTFAPNGETTPIRTMKAAMGQARDFIYIEDQYFTPPDDYVQALINAAGHVRALFITMPYWTDQPYGGRRRADVLNHLRIAWGSKLHLGTPLRRFLHETPALTTNSGRMRLANKLSAGCAICDLGPLSHIPTPPFWAFVGNELLLVHAVTGAPSGAGDAAYQSVEIVRAAGSSSWGAQPIEHPDGTPVLAVQIPYIYVHAKVMIVDDLFLFVGSSNINRRGLYHDGEINSFTIPQHLKGDPHNPARLLRSRLMAEHAGLSTEIGQALFADPISAIPYFSGRSWYMGAPRQGLDFLGSIPPDVGLGTADSVGGWALKVLIGSLREAAMHDVWALFADPTTTLDPSPTSKGPEFP